MQSAAEAEYGLVDSEERTTPAASSYSTSSRSHNSRSKASSQVVSDREVAEKLSASLNESTRPTETEDERQARIERERFEQREKLRKERQADEDWAKYYREREDRREEGRRKNEEQRRSADDWETRFEDGRRRLEQERATRTPEDRHDPTVDDDPAGSSGDDDWEAQLAEGCRRLDELKRTEAANINNVRPPKRERRPSHSSTALPRRPDVYFASTDSSSSPNVTSSSSGVDHVEAERARLYAFEAQQMARERNDNDGMLDAQIAEAEADIRNAEARLANRNERLVEGMYDAYVYDDLNTGTSHRNEHSLHRGITVADSQQGGATNGMRESGRERALRVIANRKSIRHSRRAFSHDPADRIGREQGEAAKQVQGTLALEEPSTRSAVPILANSPSGDSSHHNHVDEVNPLESRIRAWNSGVNTDTPTLEEGPKTWSNVKPDGGKQIDEFVRKLNEDDDHCSTVSDAAASIFSVASLASSATDLSTASGYSGDQIIAATQHLVHLLSTCEQLRPLYETAIESNHIGPERFSRNFRRLLKKYSHDLEEEAHDHLDFLAAHLVRNKARYVASDIVKKFQGSQPRPNPSKESAADEDADPSSDEGEPKPMINSGIAEDIVSASEFLLQSRAFVIFCTEFQKFVAPPLPTEPAPIPVSKTDLVPKCGKEIFSDFMELRQGGIAQLEKHIEESTGARIIRKNSIQGNPNNSSAYGMVRTWIQKFLMRITGHKGRKPSQGLPQHNTQPACTSQSNRNPSPQGVKILNLMSCMRGSRNGKVLHQDDLEKVDCDKALFLFMRERIKERRGKLKSTLSLRAIRGIEFVKAP
ncbi:hypothetical protein SLS56_007332 [Neofusicoccum ribis]|uniref:Uncharacterized protein n=1 Tax=Neofusicoccum ribis TaxID=45134 RepID=A0ABR3SNS5_9PEZI